MVHIPLRRAGIRLQATLAAAGVVAAALVLASVALVLLLQRQLVATVEESLTALVAEDARVLVSGGVDALVSSEADRGSDNVLVEVVDPTGTVVFSSRIARQQPGISLRPAPGETVVTGRTDFPRIGALAPPLVVAQGVDVGGRPYVVVASTSLEAQEEAVTTTGLLLAGGVPLLTGLVGLVTWWRIGRALQSVEAIRGQVERIEATNLADRVPVPAAHDEVAQLAMTMNDMLARLQAADARQRRFVADASHELRSPLATLSASVDVGSGDRTGQAWTELTPILQSETRRMARLVDDLLTLSRLDDATSSAAVTEVDLDDVADGEARRVRQTGETAVVTRLQPVKVRGDEHRLAQVLRNLVDNAVVAARTTVRLTVQEDAAGAQVVVEDDGPGVPPAERDRIFDRFVRLDESRSRSSGGSGLGLAISRQIVAAHGGRIEVDESELGGARFTVRLPSVGATAGDRRGQVSDWGTARDGGTHSDRGGTAAPGSRVVS